MPEKESFVMRVLGTYRLFFITFELDPIEWEYLNYSMGLTFQNIIALFILSNLR